MSIVEVFSLLGGVGLFLFGMTIMSAGLKMPVVINSRQFWNTQQKTN